VQCSHCNSDNPAGTKECCHCGTNLIPSPQGSTDALENSPTLISQSDPSSRPVPTFDDSRIIRIRPGTEFGPRYKILSVLGEGGMGVVYRAYDRELDRDVALKLIRPSLCANPQVIERFKREIVLASKISHKNVLRIHDLGDVDGIKFLSMNFVDGEDLGHKLQLDAPISISKALPIIGQLCSALKAAHDEGVVHRDLKPQNILIGRDGTTYITDFGIARSVESDATSLTATDVIIGTPQYMSPEQVKGDKVDQRSDLYSLGLIVYEMLTGDVAFKGGTTFEVMMKRLQRRPREPRELNPRIPPYLARIVMKCLEPDVAHRYQDAAEILRDLKDQRVTLSLTGEIRRRATPQNFIIVLVMLVLLLAGLWYRERTRRPDAGAESQIRAVSLAILPMKNATNDPSVDWLSLGLAEMLTTDLGQSSAVRPVAGARLYQILSDLKLLDEKRYDASAIKTIADLTSAGAVLTGQFFKLGDTIRVDALLRDLQTGSERTIKVEGRADLAGLVDDLAEKIRENLSLSPESLKTEVFKKLSEVTTKSSDALRLYNQGLLLMHQGNHLQAAESFEQAIKDDSSFAMAYAKLAQAQYNLGYGAKAEEAASKAVQFAIGLPPSEYYNIIAARARIANEHEKAIDAYKKLLASAPSDTEAAFNLGSVYETAGEWDEAIENYRLVLDRDPKYADALGALARTTIKQGEPQAALGHLSQLLAIQLQLGNEQGRAATLHMTGVAYKRLKKFDEAVRYYQESLNLRRKIGDKRGVSSSLSELAQVYQFTGKPDEALKSYRQALQISREIGDQKGLGDDLNNLGNLMEKLGRYDESLDYYKQALKIAIERGAKDEIALRLGNIGQVYSTLGQFEDAYTYFGRELQERRAIGDNRGIANSLVGIGDLLVSQGRYDDALKHHLEALSLWREVGDTEGVGLTSLSVADVLEAQGRYSAALKSAQEAEAALRQIGQNYWLAYTLVKIGHIYILLGSAEPASRSLQHGERLAVEIGREDLLVELLINKGEWLRLRGQLSEAKQMFSQASEQSLVTKRQPLVVASGFHLGSVQAQLGELGEAETMLSRVRKDADKAGLKPLALKALVELARTHLLQKKYSRALSEASQAVTDAVPLGCALEIAQAYHLAGKSLQAQGRVEQALENYKRSLLTLDMIRQGIETVHQQELLGRWDLKPIYEDAIAFFKAKNREAEIAAYLQWQK
jgi:serine/threonine protein kinase/Tfp pilus assembly protein PilF